MTEEDIRNAEFEAIIGELVEAGYVEEYVGADGQAARRLTASGEQVARQLAMVADEEAAAMMAGMVGGEMQSEGTDAEG
jgi:DNA-binding MarR family transcriptional regulator